LLDEYEIYKLLVSTLLLHIIITANIIYSYSSISDSPTNNNNLILIIK
jgi:hypothetical protein